MESKMKPQYDRLSESERSWLREEVDRFGRRAVSRHFGIHDQTILRLLAGEPVQRLTLRMVRESAAKEKLARGPGCADTRPITVSPTVTL